MSGSEQLVERTESYLKALVADIARTPNAQLDAAAPFGELGVDSFRVLKIIKALESDFGTLPKTLLFENFTIRDLAQYFVVKHTATLTAKFARERPGEKVAAPAAIMPAAPPANTGARVAVEQVVAVSSPPAPRPILLAEKDAYAHPELGDCLRGIFERYKNEGSVSRGTRNIAPHLFIGAARKGFFNYSRSKDVILAYSYTGPKEYFPTLVREMHEHCAARRLELNILTEEEVESLAGIRVSSTPFGALQRVLNLQQFTLDGSAMRRLRYLVSRFAKSGECRTEEFPRDAGAELRAGIASVIDQWCAARTMVNPLIYCVRDEIVAGTLSPEHRIFLTYVDDVLHNVILISALSAERNGYLMDLEFYTGNMPLGGLEFAITRIIDVLIAEGRDVLSLGGTYGCKLQTSDNADPDVDRILDDLRMQNIFNDEGNLQFKNKFRPENKTIYLLRPVGECKPDNVVDVIMMIADPMRMQTSDAENQIGSGAQPPADVLPMIPATLRSAVLAQFDFNPLEIPAAQVEFDLKTDSWAQLEMPAIAARRRFLHSQLPRAQSPEEALREILPFEHFVLTASGRTAERVFYKSWANKGVVPQNLLFPTTLFHQIDNGFTPLEIPQPRVFDLGSDDLYRGDLDEAQLELRLSQDPAGVAFVCIELSNNAVGGHPVSLSHLKRVKALLAPHSIPLVLDGTRVLENAQFLLENEPSCASSTVWDLVREMFACANAVILSLPKDFCVNGGVVATHDPQLFRAMQACIREEGCGLDIIDRKLVALSLRSRGFIETQMRQRKDAVWRISAALQAQGVPVVHPAGGHCVLIDVKRLGEFAKFRHPVSSFLAWLYLNTGIRGGAHSVGMQKGGALNDLVRLAVPVGLAPGEIDELAQRLLAVFAEPRDIPEIAPLDPGREPGDIHAKYRLLAFHRPAGALVPWTPPSAAPAHRETVTAQPALPSARERSSSPQKVAVVGMSGRYPKARNLQELWANLVAGRDCIETIPAARMEQRLRNSFTREYRGGFIDDVDRFDARFFGISSKDAQILDPQERLFLEVAHEAIEDAGYYPDALGTTDAARDIGVFVGAVWSTYQMLGVEEKMAGKNVNPSSFSWSIANRVSYWMNLTGPSLTLDTACSASLTAIALACDAIARGECSGAIVGAVNLDLHQSKFDINLQGGSLSKDGVCRSFGKGANGYVSGEGVGALFLKPLDRAIADGDQIYGVVSSAVVTHSGRTSGYMVPGPQPQTRLVLKALERAEVDARSIGYIEAHGTGTDLGDTIEIAGLSAAFGKYGVAKGSCAVGCIKTNIGHLEAASGVVGVQKILLQMRHRKLVPSLHSAELNAGIDFASTPFHVQQCVQDWQPQEIEGVRQPRRAGISAIGAGGTNAHVILEEYECAAPQAQIDATRERVFPLSARTETQLRQAALRLRDFLRIGSEVSEDDIAHTLQVGRKSFEQRVAVVAATRAELIEKLTAFLEGRHPEDVAQGNANGAAPITGLLSPAEKRDFVALIAQSRDARRIAQLWSQGVIADWRGLDIGQAGRKTSLPTYPFEGERYWIADRMPTPAAPAVSIAEHVASEPGLPQPSTKRAATYLFTPAAPGATAADGALLLVRRLFADELCVPVDGVAADAQIMDTGITSLGMAQITRSLKERIDAEFSPIAFFECTTVRALAEMLARKYAVAFEHGALAGSPAEAIAPAAAQEEAQGEPRVPLHVSDSQSELVLSAVESIAGDLSATRTVLLTGATGFLGIHILAELLGIDAQARVYCLVRATSRKHALRRILDQAHRFELELDERRIIVLCGDINQPQLGLSAEDWELCSRDADEIVHASAHVNHIEGYATFRSSTHAMKEVIRLAGSGRRKLVQFISSTAACALKIGDEFSIFEKEDFNADGAHVFGGYGQSKWVQEVFLQRAHEQGLPFVIYRFGELSGSSRTGRGQTDDMVHRLLQMRLAVDCREKISSDVLDMLPVDLAARLIAGTGRNPELWNRIVHATHLKPYSFANLYRKAQALGLEFEPVTRAQYLARCHDFVKYVYSTNPVNGFVLECVLRDAEGSIRNRKMMDGYFSVIFPFQQDNFRRSLANLGLPLPDWNALLDRYFETWRGEDCGFIARIHEYRGMNRFIEVQELDAATRANGVRPAPAERRRRRSKQGAHDSTVLESVHEG